MQQLQETVKDKDTNKEAPKVVSKVSKQLSTLVGNVIQDYHDAILKLNQNRSLTVQFDGREETVVRQAEERSSSILVQNLERCQVTM